jgi:hypothetical protein
MIWDVRTQKMLDLLAPHHNIITSVRRLLHVQDHDALPDALSPRPLARST